MSEEENKAIEFIQKFEENEIHKDKLEMNIYGGWKMGDIYKAELNCHIRIILNLIQKQQKEIEELTKQSKNLDIEAQSYLEELVGDSGMKERTIAKLQAEIEKKDKIINEMTEYIAELDIKGNICSNVLCYKECDKMFYKECESCIKQYFEKKVEESK